MAEEGGRLASMDSVESRWVFEDDGGGVSGDDDLPPRMGLDYSEDDDGGEQRLIRTGPRVDSFDVEALEVPGAQRLDYEDFSLGKKIVLVFQTLGVVFGDVGTSPLYTFDVMFNKAPINGEEDILGALSLVLYTLILIPLIKYVIVVLWANDDGEGGTFALYSLICRHAKVSLIPNQLPSDARISSFQLKVPSPELERSLKIKEKLENSYALKKLLLMLVLLGTSMVIADGVVTPAMSGLSLIFSDIIVMNFGKHCTCALLVPSPDKGEGGVRKGSQPSLSFVITWVIVLDPCPNTLCVSGERRRRRRRRRKRRRRREEEEVVNFDSLRT